MNLPGLSVLAREIIGGGIDIRTYSQGTVVVGPCRLWMADSSVFDIADDDGDGV